MAVVEQWNPTSEEYHAERDHVSHSALEVFRRSRRRYHGRFVTGEIPQPEPTASMQLGTILHTLVLEPEAFPERYAMAPKCDRRTKEGKADWAEFVEQCAGRKAISADEYETAIALATAIAKNETASEWLAAAGLTEHSIRWQDNETGLLCKSRRDRVIDGFVIDLKTCRDAGPEAFARSAAAFGYFRQAAWYLDGEKASGGGDKDFVFIAVSTEPPHEVACYTPEPDDLIDARLENQKLLNRLADCWQYDNWLGPHEKGTTRLRLPRYVRYENEWEIAE